MAAREVALGLGRNAQRLALRVPSPPGQLCQGILQPRRCNVVLWSRLCGLQTAVQAKASYALHSSVSSGAVCCLGFLAPVVPHDGEVLREFVPVLGLQAALHVLQSRESRFHKF